MRNAKARSQPAAAAEIQKPDEQWRRELTPEQYAVLRRGHTEMAFTGKYVRNSGDRAGGHRHAEVARRRDGACVPQRVLEQPRIWGISLRGLRP